MAKKINIVLFGIGNVGSALINKAIKNKKTLIEEKGLDLKFPVITNSTVAFFEKEGTAYAWEANFVEFAIPFKFEDVLAYISNTGLDNLVAVDASGSAEVIEEYINLLNKGLNIISVNNKFEKLPPGLRKEIAIEAESKGVIYKFIKAEGKDKAAGLIIEAVAEIAENQNRLAS